MADLEQEQGVAGPLIGDLDEEACACCEEDEDQDWGPLPQAGEELWEPHPGPEEEEQEEGEADELSEQELGEQEEEGKSVGVEEEPEVELPESSGAADAPPCGLKKKKKARTSTSRARAQAQAQSQPQPGGSRLGELARPRQRPAEPPPEVEKEREKEQRPRKPQTVRPSLLVRLRPTNLEEAMEAFFQSGFSEAPQFTYAHPDPVVAKHFQENSNVCFELLPEAQRILQRVQEEYGGPDLFMQKLYGEGKVGAEELRDMIASYLQEHGVEDKVEIRIVDNMLAVANVVKPSPDEKYIVNIARGQISKTMVQGICDHEVGTHLLRMMNDEYQVWHGCRDRYRLLNPWTTEEGFATLNTYISMPCKLLYPQALRYYAVCRGAQVGFVELFQELRQHVSDPKRCWQMCCRIKRGMHDTSQAGAFYMDQAYFKGAVEILRHLDEIDFGRLYGGQIALQDLDKVYFLLRKDVVRLPRFLNTAEKLKVYLAHCRGLIRENQIEAAVERVCRPVFIRAAKDFFAPKQQKAFSSTSTATAPNKDKVAVQRLSLGLDSAGPSSSSCSPEGRGQRAESQGQGHGHGRTRVLDLGRLADLARPRRDAAEPEAQGPSPQVPRRDLDIARLAELALPRGPLPSGSGGRASSSSAQPQPQEDAAPPVGRAPDLARLLDLARPRQWTQPPPSVRHLSSADVGPLDFVKASASQIRSHRGGSAPPRQSSSSDRSPEATEADSAEAVPPAAATTEPRPPPDPPRLPDLARLAALAAPRKVCTEKSSGESCNCIPRSTSKKRRRSKLRLLALVQKKVEDSVDLGESLLSSSQASTWCGTGQVTVAEDESLPSFETSLLMQDTAQCESVGSGGKEGANESALPRSFEGTRTGAGVQGNPELPGAVSEAEAQADASAKAGAEVKGEDTAVAPEAQCQVLPQASAGQSHHRQRAVRKSSRPRISLPSATAMPLARSEGQTQAPTWKAVPIKTMQLQLSL